MNLYTEYTDAEFQTDLRQLLFPFCEPFTIRLGESESSTRALLNHLFDQALFLVIKFLSGSLDILLRRDFGIVDIDTHRGLYAEITNDLLRLVRRIAQFFRRGDVLIKREWLGDHLEFCFAACKRELGPQS